MNCRRATIAVLAPLALASVAGCATSDTAELGDGKAEFEQYAQGGNYRFQYLADGPDGYRTVLWRQGESLSDDRKDEALVAGVVKTVFLEKFCKELKQPVALNDGSPVPLGSEGKWGASLRCAAPPPAPPKAKPEKKKPIAKPKGDAVADAKPDTSTTTTGSTTTGSTSSAPKKSASNDGPMVCEARGGGFDCKPKR